MTQGPALCSRRWVCDAEATGRSVHGAPSHLGADCLPTCHPSLPAFTLTLTRQEGPQRAWCSGPGPGRWQCGWQGSATPAGDRKSFLLGRFVSFVPWSAAAALVGRLALWLTCSCSKGLLSICPGASLPCGSQLRCLAPLSHLGILSRVLISLPLPEKTLFI